MIHALNAKLRKPNWRSKKRKTIKSRTNSSWRTQREAKRGKQKRKKLLNYWPRSRLKQSKRKKDVLLALTIDRRLRIWLRCAPKSCRARPTTGSGWSRLWSDSQLLKPLLQSQYSSRPVSLKPISKSSWVTLWWLRRNELKNNLPKLNERRKSRKNY